MFAAGHDHSSREILKILESAKVFVLDFDGTLVDSNEIKRSAFEKCFAAYPDSFDAILQYCRGNNHVPREVKFRHVFENILKLPFTPVIEKQMLDHYAAETTEQVIATDEIPGATRFLEHFFRQKEFHLLSSTPHIFLEQILERRGLKKYFKKIQGAPVHKATWLKQFVKEGNWGREEIVFIGDSPEDCQSAKEAELDFIAIGKELKSRTKYWIDNFENFF